MSISILKGDVTNPVGDGVKVIVHCVNDIPCMGSGVAAAISKKWPHTREAYMNWGNHHDDYENVDFKLGDIMACRAEENIFVCHLVGQKNVGGETIDGKYIPPVRYEAIREGMYRLRQSIKRYRSRANREDVSIHAPLLGTDLAGGTLEKVYEIVNEVFGKSEIDFHFYAFTAEHFENLQKIHLTFTENMVVS